MKIKAVCDIFGDSIVWNLLYLLVTLTIIFSAHYIIVGSEMSLRGMQVSIFWTLYLNLIYTMKKHIIPLINKHV